jgi:ribosomal-protein-serine acetyltransferase
MFQRVVAPGVEIRLMQEPDAEPMFAVVERNRAYLREWLPWVDATQSAADVREFIRGAVERYETGNELNATIWIDGEVAGGIGHHVIDWPNRATSLGYWLDAAQQGRGVVTRCCHTLLDYLFDERGLHRVEIRHGTGNARSGAVPRRLGFRRDGVLRDGQWVNDRWVDLVVWSILEEEWRKH